MKPVILCVDDEPRVLSGLRRNLRQHFEVLTALGGQPALAILAERSDIAVVMSDMRMPEMDGAEFLKRARAGWPDVVRLLLTGQSDMDSAIKAVNEGQIFRFLTKPSTPDDLIAALSQAVEQHRLLRAEEELTEGTVKGVVSVLVDVLALVNPTGQAESHQTADLVRDIAQEMGLGNIWEFEVAAMLATLGRIAVPDALLERAAVGAPLKWAERETIAAIPGIGADLIARVPRLGDIAEMVRLQKAAIKPEWARNHDDRIGLGVGLVKVAAVLVKAMGSTGDIAAAREEILEQRGLHHPAVMDAVAAMAQEPASEEEMGVRPVPLSLLEPGQVLEEDLVDSAGMLIVAAGMTVTKPLLAKLERFRELRDMPDAVVVRGGRMEMELAVVA